MTHSTDIPPASTWWAPGRVNLIGEHTDYNDGYVLPFAIDRGVTCWATRREDQTLTVTSAQHPDELVEARIAELAPGAVEGWAAYPFGVAWALQQDGVAVPGADLQLDGNVPPGAGLSSSAALECAVAGALTTLAGARLTPAELARVAQRAENDFVGVPTGPMDQAASMLATAGHALFLDTRTGATQAVPLDPAAHGLALLVIDTRAEHRHAGGEYAARRRDCERAAQLLEVPALRDIAAPELRAALARLDDEVLRRRVRHVVTEDERVLATVALLRAGRLPEIGSLLTASHASLRDDFEVTVGELDLAVDVALSAGAFGARMTGGGFGGCVLALVPTQATAVVSAQVEQAFRQAGYRAPRSFVVTPGPGAHERRR